MAALENSSRHVRLLTPPRFGYATETTLLQPLRRRDTSTSRPCLRNESLHVSPRFTNSSSSSRGGEISLFSTIYERGVHVSSVGHLWTPLGLSMVVR